MKSKLRNICLYFAICTIAIVSLFLFLSTGSKKEAMAATDSELKDAYSTENEHACFYGDYYKSDWEKTFPDGIDKPFYKNSYGSTYSGKKAFFELWMEGGSTEYKKFGKNVKTPFLFMNDSLKFFCKARTDKFGNTSRFEYSISWKLIEGYEGTYAEGEKKHFSKESIGTSPRKVTFDDTIPAPEKPGRYRLVVKYHVIHYQYHVSGKWHKNINKEGWIAFNVIKQIESPSNLLTYSSTKKVETTDKEPFPEDDAFTKIDTSFNNIKMKDLARSLSKGTSGPNIYLIKKGNTRAYDAYSLFSDETFSLTSGTYFLHIETPLLKGVRVCRLVCDKELPDIKTAGKEIPSYEGNIGVVLRWFGTNKKQIEFDVVDEGIQSVDISECEFTNSCEYKKNIDSYQAPKNQLITRKTFKINTEDNESKNYRIRVRDKYGNNGSYVISYSAEPPDFKCGGYGLYYNVIDGIHYRRGLSRNFINVGYELVPIYQVRINDSVYDKRDEWGHALGKFVGVANVEIEDYCGNVARIKFVGHNSPIPDQTNDYNLDFTAIEHYKVDLATHKNRFEKKGEDGTTISAAKNYIFKNKESAFNFVVAKIYEFRVVEQYYKGEKYYKYYTKLDQEEPYEYQNKEEVDKVVRAHAESYITKGDISLDSLRNTGAKLMDENWNENPLSFFDTGKIPQHKPFDGTMFASTIHPQRSITAKGLPDFDVGRKLHIWRYNPETGKKGRGFLNIKYGKSISNILQDNGALEEGFYLIHESDNCENFRYHLVYLDLTPPLLKARFKYGDTERDVVINKEYLEAHNTTIKAVTFDVLSFSDEIDGNRCTLKESGNTSGIYLSGDTILQYSADAHRAGIYNITLRDRSGNTLSFRLNIAQGTPRAEMGVLKDDNREYYAQFTFYPGKENQIISLGIYKKDVDGSEIKLEKDDNDKTINAFSLQYDFYAGGTFICKCRDSYGRTIVSEEITFYKGLPEGTLSIREKGIVNREVWFRYDYSKYKITVYDYTGSSPAEVRKISSDSEISDSDFSWYKEAEDTATKHATAVIDIPKNRDKRAFCILVQNKKTPSSYRKYVFYIDKELSQIYMVDNEGTHIENLGRHNKPFKIYSDDKELTFEYSFNKGYVDADKEYFEKSGKYTITVRDKAGNSKTFVLQLSTTVLYQIKGKHSVQFDGSILAANSLEIQSESHLTVYRLTGPENLGQGEPITKDGDYELLMKDDFGNAVSLKMTIDTTPPEASVSSKLTKDKVTFDWEIGATVELYKEGKKIKKLQRYEVVDEEGEFFIKVYDKAKNCTEISFRIKRHIRAGLSVPSGAIVSSSVSVNKSEDVGVEAKLDGTSCDEKENYSTPGKYEITIKDTLGNIKTFVFEIIKSKRNKFDLKLTDKHSIVSTLRDGSLIENTTTFNSNGAYQVTIEDEFKKRYTLDFEINNTPLSASFKKKNGKLMVENKNKKNVYAKLYKNGKLINENYNFSPISKSGKYTLAMTDDFGNSNEIDFKFRKTLNAGGIVAIFITILLICIVVGLSLWQRYKNKIS